MHRVDSKLKAMIASAMEMQIDDFGDMEVDEDDSVEVKYNKYGMLGGP